MVNNIAKQDDTMLKLWYLSLALGVVATGISLYNLYLYHNGEK